MTGRGAFADLTTRRQLLATAAAGAMFSTVAKAEKLIDLPLPGGPDARTITTAFPQKGPMILQRTRPPLLETPFEAFDKGTLTPNDRSTCAGIGPSFQPASIPKNSSWPCVATSTSR